MRPVNGGQDNKAQQTNEVPGDTMGSIRAKDIALVNIVFPSSMVAH